MSQGNVFNVPVETCGVTRLAGVDTKDFVPIVNLKLRTTREGSQTCLTLFSQLLNVAS